MKTLYLKLTELLREIPELKFIEENFGQLQESNPPIAYPAVLITMEVPNSDDIDEMFQNVFCNFEILIITKTIGESNSLAPEEQREKALEYYDLSDKVYQKLQGYSDGKFESFSRRSVTNRSLRKGLKTVAHRFSTSWREHTAN